MTNQTAAKTGYLSPKDVAWRLFEEVRLHYSAKDANAFSASSARKCP